MAKRPPANRPLDLDLLRPLAEAAYEPKTGRAIWLQIYDRLLDACNDGLLSFGAKLPGEIHLAEIFRVTRVTMRRALAKLQQEGQLQSRKGVGIFIRQPPSRYAIEHSMRFADNLASGDGREISTRTISVNRALADADVAEALGIEPDTDVFVLTRLRLLDHVPVYYAIKYFPAHRFPDFKADYADDRSVLSVFRKHGIRSYKRVETHVFGGFATRGEAEALHLTHRTPLLRTASRNETPDGIPIEFTRGAWPLASVELIFRQ